MNLLTLVAASCAVVTAGLFWRNLWLFRRLPAPVAVSQELPAVSVLIPARDEADGIGDAIQSIVASRGIQFEVLVLDDQSQDGTAEIVRAISKRYQSVRLVEGRPLPDGWCGKAFACYQLVQLARHEELLFLDADVRVTSDALARAVQYRRHVGVDLLSGFPRQVVKTLGEAMLVPLIYIVLLSYLPFDLMRRTRWSVASAGCGQFFLTSRQAYARSGGHLAIRGSLHDGIMLPRAYRRAGCSTDVVDGSDIASCRMYGSGRQAWRGFLKNAHEGLARDGLIVPMTGLMLMAYVLPAGLACVHGLQGKTDATAVLSYASAAVAYSPRLATAARYDRGWLSAALFPLSILMLVILQWTSWFGHRLGRSTPWRGRVYRTSSPGACDGT